MNVYDKLTELDITLPPVAIPAAAYVPFMQTGNLVFLSGHIARKEGKPWVGQLGKNMTTEEGKAAARGIAIELMGTLHVAVGDLNRVTRIVKLMSLVNSTGDFTEPSMEIAEPLNFPSGFSARPFSCASSSVTLRALPTISRPLISTKAAPLFTAKPDQPANSTRCF